MLKDVCAAALTLIQRAERFFVAHSQRHVPERRGSLLAARLVLMALDKG